MMRKDDGVAKVVGPEEVARRLRLEYSRGVKDQTEKVLEGLIELGALIDRPDVPLRSMFIQASEMIMKRLGIASVAIALRSPSDSMYRYETIVGVPEEIVAEFRKITYEHEQLTDESAYKCHEISKYSKLYLSEDHPYAPGEEFSYQRPGLLDMKRRSSTDSLEADYIDTYFFDSKGEILGWIELSGTRTKKLPDATCVKWTELIALILAMATKQKHPHL